MQIFKIHSMFHFSCNYFVRSHFGCFCKRYLTSFFCNTNHWIVIKLLSKGWSCFEMELFMLSLSNAEALSYTDMMHVLVSHQNLLGLIKPSCGSKIWPWIHPEGTRNSIPSQISPHPPLSLPVFFFFCSTTDLARSYFLTVLNYNWRFSYISHMYWLK